MVVEEPLIKICRVLSVSSFALVVITNKDIPTESLLVAEEIKNASITYLPLLSLSTACHTAPLLVFMILFPVSRSELSKSEAKEAPVPSKIA
jgi:hypothetical protein